MGKISDIVDGWKNVIIKNPEVEKDIKRKALICDGCEFSSEEEDSIYDLEKDKLVTYKGYCKSCGCPFISLLRSPNKKCKENKW